MSITSHCPHMIIPIVTSSMKIRQILAKIARNAETQSWNLSGWFITNFILFKVAFVSGSIYAWSAPYIVNMAKNIAKGLTFHYVLASHSLIIGQATRASIVPGINTAHMKTEAIQIKEAKPENLLEIRSCTVSLPILFNCSHFFSMRLFWF